MNTPSAKAGTASGCLVWVVLVGVIGTCLLPVGLIVSVFTATSTAAANLVGPLVCPTTTHAIIEISNTAYQTELGAELPAVTREMVCVNDQGTVMARPAPLPDWIWLVFVTLALVLLAGLLSFALAAPAGVMIGTLWQRVQRKRNNQ